MQRPRPAAVIFLLILVSASFAWAVPRERVLHRFAGGNDGGTPAGALVSDAKGNLYGTTIYGGAHNEGTVFKLTRSGQGWRETVLHTFGNAGDGSLPYGALIFDNAGNLYGTTDGGGIVQKYCPSGCGTVFELTPISDGLWKEKVLHRFDWSKGDGSGPLAGMIFDQAGKLYGTTSEGGGGVCGGNCGTVFELTRSHGGRWTERVIYSFSGQDGEYPASNLLLDRAGNLYGSTSFGGPAEAGVVFKLAPASGGQWNETVLHAFAGGSDGSIAGGLNFRAGEDGLYGVTEAGGVHRCGTFYQLTESQGNWTETVLHAFRCQDGQYPTASLVPDRAGNLYGTANGSRNDPGVIFKLSRASGGNWEEHVLYRFTGHEDGEFPGGLIFGADGNLYGPAGGGGDPQCGFGNGCGVVFETVP